MSLLDMTSDLMIALDYSLIAFERNKASNISPCCISHMDASGLLSDEIRFL